MNSSPKFRQANSLDLTAVCELLESYQLPSSDCKEHISNFIVAERDDSIIAVGGFESCCNTGLLRSFAVRLSEKGSGLGEKIFSQVKAKAIASGITQFYLLTTTSSDYFARFGFSQCNRESVPESVKATKQFSDLCPSTATVMVLNLST